MLDLEIPDMETPPTHPSTYSRVYPEYWGIQETNVNEPGVGFMGIIYDTNEKHSDGKDFVYASFIQPNISLVLNNLV